MMKKDQKSTPGLRDLLRMREPQDRGGKKPILKKTHFTIWYFVIAFIIILLIQNYVMTRKVEDVIPYSEFKESLRTGKIKELTITPESINGETEAETKVPDRPGGRPGSGEGIGNLPCEIYGEGREQVADQYHLVDYSSRLFLYLVEDPLLPDRAGDERDVFWKKPG